MGEHGFKTQGGGYREDRWGMVMIVDKEEAQKTTGDGKKNNETGAKSRWE